MKKIVSKLNNIKLLQIGDKKKVKIIGFLTLLIAGTTSLISFKYSLFKDIVKMLKQRSISAGHFFIIKNKIVT